MHNEEAAHSVINLHDHYFEDLNLSFIITVGDALPKYNARGWLFLVRYAFRPYLGSFFAFLAIFLGFLAKNGKKWPVRAKIDPPKLKKPRKMAKIDTGFVDDFSTFLRFLGSPLGKSGVWGQKMTKKEGETPSFWSLFRF